MRVFHLPLFLEGVLTRESYVRWLQRKAQGHIRRDREGGNTTDSVSEYKWAIHEAVCDSGGRDHYTGETLYCLVSTYSNDESKLGKRVYKAQFALLAA